MSYGKGQKPYDFTYMWTLRPGIINKLIDTDYKIVVIRGERGWEEGDMGKWIKHMAMEGSQTLDGEHAIEYIDVILYA